MTAEISVRDKVDELVRKHHELAVQKRQAEIEGWELLTDFPGTLIDALKMGLVKPSIPTPSGWLQTLIKRSTE